MVFIQFQMYNAQNTFTTALIIMRIFTYVFYLEVYEQNFYLPAPLTLQL